MKKSFSRLSWQIFSACFVIALLQVFPVSAQEDPNPDSPSPILISHPDSTRALVVPENVWRGVLPKPSNRSFNYGTETYLKLFVTNIELLDGEGPRQLTGAEGRPVRSLAQDLGGELRGQCSFVDCRGQDERRDRQHERRDQDRRHEQPIADHLRPLAAQQGPDDGGAHQAASPPTPGRTPMTSK